MPVTLDVRPEYTYGSIEEFVESSEGYSAALDGAVIHDGLQVIRDGPYLIADHHGGPRRSLLATCQLVWEARRDGTLERNFYVDGEFRIDIKLNHLDEDGLTAYLILRNDEEIFSDVDKIRRTREFVSLEGTLDRHLAIYPQERPVWPRMLYVFDPLYQERFNGGMHRLTPEDHVGIVEEVNSRFCEYIRGRGASQEPWGEYRVLDSGEGWRIVEETGPLARQRMFFDSKSQEVGGQAVDLFIILKGVRPGGAYEYTFLAPMSAESDLSDLKSRMNKEEGPDVVIPGRNEWGGNPTCFGSPRMTGSFCSPEKVSGIIRDFTGERTRPFRWWR